MLQDREKLIPPSQGQQGGVFAHLVPQPAARLDGDDAVRAAAEGSISVARRRTGRPDAAPGPAPPRRRRSRHRGEGGRSHSKWFKKCVTKLGLHEMCND